MSVSYTEQLTTALSLNDTFENQRQLHKIQHWKPAGQSATFYDEVYNDLRETIKQEHRNNLILTQSKRRFRKTETPQSSPTSITLKTFDPKNGLGQEYQTCRNK